MFHQYTKYLLMIKSQFGKALKFARLLPKKRFYTRGTLASIMIPRLAEILTLYRDWLGSLKHEKGQLF